MSIESRADLSLTSTPPPAAPDAPPILGTWRRMYVLVLVVLLVGVLLFAWMTEVYQ